MDQLVGTAMSSDSNGICENKIKQLRRMFNPVMERLGATAWKFATPTVQAIANYTPSQDSEITPEQLVFSYTPRRITDLLHDVSTLPDSDIRRLLEDREKVIEEIRVANCEAQQAITEKLMQRQAGQHRDLPPEWGKPGKKWWVWLHEKYYSKADTNKAGSRHKQLQVHADGPFEVTDISPDGIHFRIQKPEWMAYRVDDNFTIKAIRAIQDTHPEPDQLLKEAIQSDEVADADTTVHEITRVWARRPSNSKVKRIGYEYKVFWRGYPITEASYVHEDDIDGSLMAKYDEICPRGSVHTDRSADIDIYLRKHPGLLNLRSSTVLADDAIIADIGTENTSGPGKKAKAPQRAAKAAGGRKSTQTRASTRSAPMQTTMRGRVRKSISRLAFHITPSDTQGLNSYLNELYNIDTDKYERTVGDLTFAHNVARDYFNVSLMCGWGGDYGDRAVHIKTCIPRLRFDHEDMDQPTRSRARHKKWKDETWARWSTLATRRGGANHVPI